MDKPIEIIVVLFVALVVGASILAFAAQVFDRAQQSTQDLAPLQSPLDSKIFTAQTLTLAQAQALATSCHDQHYRAATTQDTLCAVFRATNPIEIDALFSDTYISTYRSFSVSRESATCRAVFITYRPFDSDHLRVEC